MNCSSYQASYAFLVMTFWASVRSPTRHTSAYSPEVIGSASTLGRKGGAGKGSEGEQVLRMGGLARGEQAVRASLWARVQSRADSLEGKVGLWD